MGWLLELLIDGLQELLSQFVIDMMDLITGMFTELLSCDLSLFEELFSVVGDLYKNVIVPMGIAILLLIWIWQLFKSMFGKSGVSSEEPIELICRSCIALFFIVASKPMINYVLNLAGTPYQWVVGTDITVNSFSEYVSALEGVTGVLGIGRLNISILMLIMQFVVAWNYFKMLFIIAERYVLLGVFSYTAPLAFSTGGSKATNNILASWAKMFGGQVVLIILNAWCMKMFLSGYGNLMASSYGFTKFFVATLCLIGFCKITFKLDSYMASLGVNLGRPSTGLGAMGLMMAGGRILSFVGRGNSGSGGEHTSSSSDSGAEAGGNGNMPGASAGPIPMSFDTENGSMDAEKMQQENGFNDVEDMGENSGMQGGIQTEDMEDPGVLDELGVTEVNASPEENAGFGMNDGASGQSDMSQEQGGISEDGEVSEFSGEGNGQSNGINESGMSENGFREETNIIGEMGDYPVEEEFDDGESSGMDLDGGTIESGAVDGEESSYGSGDSSYNGGLSSGSEGNGLNSEDTDTISEMGEQTGISGFDSSVGAEKTGSYEASGSVSDTITSEGAAMPGTSQIPDTEFSDRRMTEYETPDDDHEIEARGNIEKPMNHLNSGKTIPSVGEKPKRTKTGKTNFQEVPRSREELKKRKQGNNRVTSKDNKHD